MFGTIAHGTLKPGQATKLEEMNAEWKRDIRPNVPGRPSARTGGLHVRTLYVLDQREVATINPLISRAEMAREPEWGLRDAHGIFP